MYHERYSGTLAGYTECAAKMLWMGLVYVIHIFWKNIHKPVGKIYQHIWHTLHHSYHFGKNISFFLFDFIDIFNISHVLQGKQKNMKNINTIGLYNYTIPCKTFKNLKINAWSLTWKSPDFMKYTTITLPFKSVGQ